MCTLWYDVNEADDVSHGLSNPDARSFSDVNVTKRGLSLGVSSKRENHVDSWVYGIE